MVPSDENNPNAEGLRRLSEPLAPRGGQRDEKQQDDGYEVMNSIGPRDDEAASEPPQPSVVVLREHGSPSLGGTVNLILSFATPGDSHVQVLDLPPRTAEAVEQSSEPVHRVRTHLPLLRYLSPLRRNICCSSSLSSGLHISLHHPPHPLFSPSAHSACP